jgi:hypothetical protein
VWAAEQIERGVPMILSVDDLRVLAKKRIPRAIFDYAAGGAYEERTLGRNTADLGGRVERIGGDHPARL